MTDNEQYVICPGCKNRAIKKERSYASWSWGYNYSGQNTVNNNTVLYCALGHNFTHLWKNGDKLNTSACASGKYDYVYRDSKLEKIETDINNLKEKNSFIAKNKFLTKKNEELVRKNIELTSQLEQVKSEFEKLKKQLMPEAKQQVSGRFSSVEVD